MATLLCSRAAESTRRPSAGFPLRCRSSGSLESVIHRVPQQVEQRIAQFVENGAVELDALPFHLEADLLAKMPGQVPHRARESGRTPATRASSALR